MVRNYRENFEFGIGKNTSAHIFSLEKELSNNLNLYKSSDEKGKDYYTLLASDSITEDKGLNSELCINLIKIINKFKSKYHIKKKSFVLIVGIGNEHITADSLGQRVCKKVVATKHLFDAGLLSGGYGVVGSFVPGVSGVNGMDSSQLIKAVCLSQKPAMIIAVDTIAARDYKRLNRCVQITDDGLVGGGGVGNDKQKLNSEFLGIPVIAIGVPLVAYLSRIIESAGTASLPNELLSWVVSTKEIDFEVDAFAALIADGINKSFHRI